MQATANRPWQAFVAAIGVLVVGLLYLLQVLQSIANLGDFEAVQRSVDEDLLVRADSAAEVYEHLALVGNVFTLIGAIYVVLAVLLLRGTYLPGARVTALVFLLVSTAGMAADHFAVQDGIRDQVSLFRFLVFAACLVAQAGLWFGPGRAWVRSAR